MTQQQYISDDIVCNHLIDIQVLYEIVQHIGMLQRHAAISSSNGITYRYGSTCEEQIHTLHRLWNHYLNTGYY
jgi:hypothetical protein